MPTEAHRQLHLISTRPEAFRPPCAPPHPHSPGAEDVEVGSVLSLGAAQPRRFLLWKICSSRLPGCCYINISAASRRLLSWGADPEMLPQAWRSEASFWEDPGEAGPQQQLQGGIGRLHWLFPECSALGKRCAKKGSLESGVRFVLLSVPPSATMLWGFCSHSPRLPES